MQDRFNDRLIESWGVNFTFKPVCVYFLQSFHTWLSFWYVPNVGFLILCYSWHILQFVIRSIHGLFTVNNIICMLRKTVAITRQFPKMNKKTSKNIERKINEFPMRPFKLHCEGKSFELKWFYRQEIVYIQTFRSKQIRNFKLGSFLIDVGEVPFGSVNFRTMFFFCRELIINDWM